MIYLTCFDGQHKQCLVCSGILEGKCTLIGYAVDRTIEKGRKCVLMIIKFDNSMFIQVTTLIDQEKEKRSLLLVSYAFKNEYRREEITQCIYEQRDRSH